MCVCIVLLPRVSEYRSIFMFAFIYSLIKAEGHKGHLHRSKNY